MLTVSASPIMAGIFFSHDEGYITPQHNTGSTWSGVWMLHDVQDGEFDYMPVSIDYLRSKYGLRRCYQQPFILDRRAVDQLRRRSCRRCDVWLPRVQRHVEEIEIAKPRSLPETSVTTTALAVRSSSRSPRHHLGRLCDEGDIIINQEAEERESCGRRHLLSFDDDHFGIEEQAGTRVTSSLIVAGSANEYR